MNLSHLFNLTINESFELWCQISILSVSDLPSLSGSFNLGGIGSGPDTHQVFRLTSSRPKQHPDIALVITDLDNKYICVLVAVTLQKLNYISINKEVIIFFLKVQNVCQNNFYSGISHSLTCTRTIRKYLQYN